MSRQKVHVQGMGVIGSGVAWALLARGVPFTWSDDDSRHTAWKACTGAVYPSPEPRDAAGYELWQQWFVRGGSPLRGGRPWPMEGLVERAQYWYRTINPPHGHKGDERRRVGQLKLHRESSFHLNAQALVTATRRELQSLRTSGQTKGERLVVAHGFNNRLTRHVWGWTRLVKLNTTLLEPAEPDAVLPRRHALYLREGRFVMAYAYPMPGTDWWYAGSTLLVQKSGAKERDPQPDYDRWLKNWYRLTDNQVPVVETLDEIVQGWRPSTGSVDQEAGQELWNEYGDGTLTAMPCWHSGVRWLPVIVDELLAKLGLTSAAGAS